MARQACTGPVSNTRVRVEEGHEQHVQGLGVWSLVANGAVELDDPVKR